jgi:hypothetical protein
MNRIFQIKVTIDHTDPSIWREFLVKEKTTLQKLHTIIQAGFGWDFKKPYLFEFRKQLIGSPSPSSNKNMYDDSGVYLGSLLEKISEKLHYHYGLQNGWKLTVKLEKFIEDHNTHKASRCIGGELNGPPESCENHSVFMKFLKELNTEISKKPSFNPYHIDFMQINQALENLELVEEDNN